MGDLLGQTVISTSYKKQLVATTSKSYQNIIPT